MSKFKFEKLDTIGSEEIAPKALKEKEKPLPITLEVPEYMKEEKPKPEEFIDAWDTSFFDKVGLFFKSLLVGIKDVYTTAKEGIKAVSDIKTILVYAGVVVGLVLLVVLVVKIF